MISKMTYNLTRFRVRIGTLSIYASFHEHSFVAGTMEKLRGFNMKDLYSKLNLTDEEFIEWLQQLRLLHKVKTCECGAGMNYKYRVGLTYPIWRCTKKFCRKEKGFLIGTWFEGARVSLKDVFMLSYFWCRQTHTISEIQFDMRRDDGSTIAKDTIVDWNNLYRDVCAQFFENHPQTIGGPGVVVEIDETVITRRKYNRGHLTAEQRWFFGGVERGSGRCFLAPIDCRDANTLLPIIQRYVRPGTIIFSDCWRAYMRIDELPEAYQHYTVNHSENFVDPETGAHTNGIESEWQKFKHRHKKAFGTARSLLSTYVSQFLWRKMFSGDDVMYNLWSQISENYVCE